jgi:hypothetical protein
MRPGAATGKPAELRRLARRLHPLAREQSIKNQEDASMDLVVWLPAMFLLGLVSMIACYTFIGACEKV